MALVASFSPKQIFGLGGAFGHPLRRSEDANVRRQRLTREVTIRIAQDTQLLLAATGDVVIQRDLTYEGYPNSKNVFGIYSSGGSVRVGGSAPDNMNLDAFVMATGGAGSFTVDSYGSGSSRGIFNLRGGMVESFYGAFGTFNSTTGQQSSGYARNFMYDRRGIIPPYYPVTNRFTANVPSARTLAWREL